MSNHTPFPSAREGEDLHRRLSAGDPVAPSDLCAAYLEPLFAALSRAYPRVDEQVVATAVEDAIIALIKNPNVFNPSRSSLDRFLFMAASGDLRNLLRRESRHHQKREQIPVEDVEDRGNTSRNDPSVLLEQDGDRRELLDRIETASEGWTEVEKKVLAAMREGHSRTGVFAELLGIAHLPVDVQQREVKRVKERIVIRLKRTMTETRSDE